MASPKVMRSPISTDSDLNRPIPPAALTATYSSSTTNSDSYLASSSSMTADAEAATTTMRQGSYGSCNGAATAAVKVEEGAEEMMTLEEFLIRAWAEEGNDEEEVKVRVGFDRVGFGIENGVKEENGEVRRGRKRSGGVVALEGLDKASQQRQRRMIKNRESAARSRERKQAYQAELETLVAKLEEENEQLVREKEEWTRARLRQLMEKVVPVVEKRRPSCVLRRVHSSEW